MLRLITCTEKDATPDEFISFWKQGYAKTPDPKAQNENDELYLNNINEFARMAREKNLVKARDCLAKLFKWKEPRNLSKSIVENNWKVLQTLGFDYVAKNSKLALKERLTGGPIWRIFFLHCCLPDKYPIFDQHVNRAMASITGRKNPLELPDSTDDVISLYLDEYRPFWEEFSGKTKATPRDVDRALWVYGKMLSSPLFTSFA